MKQKIHLKAAAAVFAGAVMCALSFAPYNVSWLAWVAFVPVLLSLTAAKGKFAAFTFWLAGFSLWLFSTDWFINIAFAAWITAAAIMGIKWLLLYFSVRFLHQKGIFFTFAFPIVLVGLEAIQGYLFGGFDWNFLAHSQYRFLHLIQIADITGAAGVSFAVAMVNGYLADAFLITRRLIKEKPEINAKMLAKYGALDASVVIVLASVFLYGHFRIENEKLSEGPLIGIVQPDVPSTAKGIQVSYDKMLERLEKQTVLCRQSGADIIAWPETMIPAPMNKEYIECCRSDSLPQKFYRRLKKLTEDFTLIAGAPYATLTIEDGSLRFDEEYNSAIIFKNGKLLDKRYDKIHLVPFGEYIPLGHISWINDLIMHFNPQGLDFTINRGKSLQRFRLKADGREILITPSICYEDTDAEFTKKSLHTNGEKSDLLLNISNDGWYVKFDGDGTARAGKEHYQRTAISAFRAVENRVTLMRSVNTGISCTIDPLGRIINGYKEGNLPEKALNRGAVEGWFSDNIILCRKRSFFSWHGRWFSRIFLKVIIVIFAAIVIEKLWLKRNKKNGRKC
ncbi:apolipoprotein N-acyltransferase [Sedimentisphaera salicampi]|uniref:apolipoprotein N-acyltransferase n=1 Tax=Sedimentisphaera salicampi TaxID=1941349 RepID=UPI000B9A4686|nr:apolipoprotein N-acyltransferase [Sedimentisphaera salicampi]OXU16082.1 Apolipoprotein N-acyltransferase [Sedimentisphaera salicampi]